jgi:hypothetical protein
MAGNANLSAGANTQTAQYNNCTAVANRLKNNNHSNKHRKF